MAETPYSDAISSLHLDGPLFVTAWDGTVKV